MASPDALTHRNVEFREAIASFEVARTRYLVAEVEGLWAEVAGLDYQSKVPTWRPPEGAKHPVTIPEEHRWRSLRIWIHRAQDVLFGAGGVRERPRPGDATWLHESSRFVYEESYGNLAEEFDWSGWVEGRRTLRERVSETFNVLTPDPHCPHSTDEDGNVRRRSDRPGAPRRLRPVKEVRERVRQRAGGRCELCGAHKEEVEITGPRDRAIVTDHIVPASLGGSRIGWNLWRLCHPCNQSKHRLLHPRGLSVALDRLEQLKRRSPDGV